MSTPTTDPPSFSGPQRPRRRRGRVFFWALFAICVAALLGSTLVLFRTSRIFTVSAGSMENTIMPGDQVFVERTGQVHRGDIIAEEQGGATYIRRVIGMPGDHVVCRGTKGRISVNGKPLNETYLYPGDEPSPTSFDVTVPAGEYWLLGDHRTIANDSNYLGPLRVTIIGRAYLVLGSGQLTVGTPETFIADGLAPANPGVPLGLVAAIVSLLVSPVLIVLIIFGTVRWIIRRIHRRRAKSREPVPDRTQTPGSGIPSSNG